MINKKSILHFISITEYVALISATVAVLVFQFKPYLWCIITALACYVLAFFIASIRAVLNCIEIFNASKLVNQEDQALVTTSSVEVLNSKKEKRTAVATTIVWLLLLAFAIVVLILYPKTIN